MCKNCKHFEPHSEQKKKDCQCKTDGKCTRATGNPFIFGPVSFCMNETDRCLLFEEKK